MTFEQLKLSRVVFELRFDNGYLFWDKCGEETRTILQKLGNDWKFVEVNPKDGNILSNKKLRAEIKFNISSVRVIQDDVENLSKFKNICDTIVPIIKNYQQIDKFKRVGNRFWYVYPVESIDIAKQLILDSGIIKLDEHKKAGFGPVLQESECMLLIVDTEKQLNYKIRIIAIERDDERLPAYSEYFIGLEKFKTYNPEYAVMLDVDISTTQDVKADSFDSADYIQKAYKKLENNLIVLLHKPN